MNTDADDKLYGPFVLQIPETYVQSQHWLCTFHLLTQGWQPNKITTSRIVTKSEIGATILEATILEAIKHWFLLWTDDVESATELQMSYDLLIDFLGDKSFMKHFDSLFPDDVQLFLVSKVWQHREKLRITTT
jgi:hypothetical protein